MNKRTRRQFTGHQKTEIVKRHLIDGVPVSDLRFELGDATLLG